MVWVLRLLQAHGAHIELVTAKVEKSLLQDTTADLVGAHTAALRCMLSSVYS